MADIDPITKQGWMSKKGGSRTNWNRRFFVLRGSFLYYYSTDTHAGLKDAKKGMIPLKDCKVEIFFHRKRAFCFKINHDDSDHRVFFLDAETEDEKYNWIEVISAAAMGPVNAPPAISEYFEALGLTEEATLSEAKKVYRKLALKNHPDRGGDIFEFKKITEAYEVICAVKETAVQEAEDYDEVRVELVRGSKGLGMSLEDSGSPPLNRVIVTNVIEGKPAADSGQIVNQDILVEVDGLGVRGIPFDDVVKALKGIGRPTIRLAFLRKKDGVAEEFDVHGAGQRKSMSEAAGFEMPAPTWHAEPAQEEAVESMPMPAPAEPSADAAPAKPARQKRMSWLKRAEMEDQEQKLMREEQEKNFMDPVAEHGEDEDEDADEAEIEEVSGGEGDTTDVDQLQQTIRDMRKQHADEVRKLKAQIAQLGREKMDYMERLNTQSPGLNANRGVAAGASAMSSTMPAPGGGSPSPVSPLSRTGRRPTRTAPQLPAQVKQKQGASVWATRAAARDWDGLPPELQSQFSPEELRRLKLTFQEFDKDGSGHITAVELKDMMGQLRMVIDIDDDGSSLQQIVSEADTDGNHEIEFVEFAALMLKYRNSGSSMLGNAVDRAMDRAFGQNTLSTAKPAAAATSRPASRPVASGYNRPAASKGGGSGWGGVRTAAAGAAAAKSKDATAISDAFIRRIERLKQAKGESPATAKLEQRLKYRPTPEDLRQNDIIQDRKPSGNPRGGAHGGARQ
jgi:hypothetical protein